MKRILIMLCPLIVLMSLTGCSSGSSYTPPELLAPVGVEPAVASVQLDTVYSMETFDAEVIPHLKELYFECSGTLDEYLVSIGDMVEQGQVLATLQVEALQEQLDSLEEQAYRIYQQGVYSDRQLAAEIEIAKVELEKLRAQGADAYTCSLKELDVQKLSLELEQAQELRNVDLGNKYAAIAELEERIENNKLVAPFSGRVVYLESLKRGSPIQSYDTVICIADESELSLRSDFIRENTFAGADRVYAKILDGEYQIEYLPYDQSEYVKTVLSGKQMPSYFSIDDPKGELESGQYAVIVVLRNYKEDVLTIPVNALYRNEEGRHVYKLVDGQRIPCPVTVGIITETKVEIIEGLSEGDVVCVSE